MDAFRDLILHAEAIAIRLGGRAARDQREAPAAFMGAASRR